MNYVLNIICLFNPQHQLIPIHRHQCPVHIVLPRQFEAGVGDGDDFGPDGGSAFYLTGAKGADLEGTALEGWLLVGHQGQNDWAGGAVVGVGDGDASVGHARFSFIQTGQAAVGADVFIRVGRGDVHGDLTKSVI